MGKTERKDGYYWVIWSEPNDWTIAKRVTFLSMLNKKVGGWKVIGHEGIFGEPTEIGPRIPEYKPKKRKK